LNTRQFLTQDFHALAKLAAEEGIELSSIGVRCFIKEIFASALYFNVASTILLPATSKIYGLETIQCFVAKTLKRNINDGTIIL